jgi:hypothetical protein
MKNLTFTLITIILFGILACKKKKDEPVYEVPHISNININGKNYAANTSGVYKAGDTLNFSVTFTDDKELSNVDISQAHSGVAWSACGYDTIFKSQGLSGTEQTVSFTYKVPLFMDMDQKNCITFYLKDADNDKEGPKSVAYLFTILCKPESKAYTFTYSTARVYNYQSTNGVQCWNMFTNTAKDKNTFDYHFTNNTYSSDLSTAPGYKSAVNYFGTPAKRAPLGFNYTTANDSVCDAIFTGLTNVLQSDNVSTGEVFICQLGYRKYTVFKITNVVTTTGDNDDYTEFEYKRYNLNYYQ